VIDLVLQDLPVFRVRMAERVDADARGEIEKSIAVDVFDDRALGSGDRDSGEGGNGLDPGREMLRFS